MYPVEHEIKFKDTTYNTSASCPDLLLAIGKDGQLHNSIHDKRDDFKSPYPLGTSVLLSVPY